MLARLRENNPLPEGTVPVGAGLAVTAAASYAYLVVAGRALGAGGFGPFGLLWSFVFLVAGVFLPFEQESSRRIVALRVAGLGARSVVRRTFALGCAFVAVAVVIIALAAPLLIDRFFPGQPLLVVGLMLGTAGYMVANLTEGVLSGHRRFGRYGAYLGGEATLRLLIAVALVIAGVRTAGPIGLALGLAPLLAAVIVLWGRRDLIEPGPEVAWRELMGGLGALIAGAVLAQTLINATPILVGALAGPEHSAEAGVFTAALVVARVPLFLFQAVQAALLPSLSGFAAAGDFDAFRAGVRRLAMAVGVLIVVGTLAAATIGPAVLTLVFGPGFVIGHRDMALLALASGGFIMAMTLALATIALGGARHVVLGWFLGVATLFTVVLVGDDPLERVARAFATSTLVAAGAMALILRRQLRRGGALTEGTIIDALNDIPFEP